MSVHELKAVCTCMVDGRGERGFGEACLVLNSTLLPTPKVDRASSLYRDGDHSVNILVAPEQILKQYEKPSPGHISGLNIVKHT